MIFIVTGGEQKICSRFCVEELWGWGKSETLKKVVDGTLYNMDESEYG